MQLSRRNNLGGGRWGGGDFDSNPLCPPSFTVPNGIKLAAGKLKAVALAPVGLARPTGYSPSSGVGRWGEDDFNSNHPRPPSFTIPHGIKLAAGKPKAVALALVGLV